MGLSKAEIIGAEDNELLEVSVPEWGGVVHIGLATAGDVEKFGRAKDEPEQMARFLAACLCDEKGNRLFDKSDFKRLSEKPFRIITRLVDEAMRHNGIGDDAEDDLEKNSPTTSSEDSLIA